MKKIIIASAIAAMFVSCGSNGPKTEITVLDTQLSRDTSYVGGTWPAEIDEISVDVIQIKQTGWRDIDVSISYDLDAEGDTIISAWDSQYLMKCVWENTDGVGLIDLGLIPFNKEHFADFVEKGHILFDNPFKNLEFVFGIPNSIQINKPENAGFGNHIRLSGGELWISSLDGFFMTLTKEDFNNFEVALKQADLIP